MRLVLKSEDETKRFAATFAEELRGGETLALVGDLGAGKTTFVKALARGLGVRGTVRSPSFVLMIPYRCHPKQKNQSGIHRLIHVDAYRLKNARQLEHIGLLEHVGSRDTITVIEWADRVYTLLPKNKMTVRFEHGSSDGERVISLIPPRGKLRRRR